MFTATKLPTWYVMLYTAHDTARAPTLRAFRLVMPTRIECVYGIPAMPVNIVYLTQGLADGLMAKRPMKNGSIQMLLAEAMRDLSPAHSESRPKMRTCFPEVD